MSANSCSTSINSTRSHSLWRRVIYFILPHLDDDEEIEEPIRCTSMDNTKENRTSRPPCLTKSCNQPVKNDVAFANKPLPPLPRAVTSHVKPKKSVQFLDIRPEVEAFIREVDASFLSPTGRKVLEQLNRLPGPPQSSRRKTVKLGTTYFSMPADDADCLSELRGMTAKLHEEHKRRLFQDLAQLIKPECRYPLRQILLERRQMIDGESARKINDRLSTAPPEDEMPEELREALTPAPLRVKWKGRQNAIPRARRLSPMAEHNHVESSTYIDVSAAEPTSLKLPGCVRNARLTAEARLVGGERFPGSKHGSIRSTISTPSFRSSRMWQSALASAPGDEDFVNPRRAPSPPLGQAKLESGDEVPTVLVRPDNIAGADVAAIARSSIEKWSSRPSAPSSNDVKNPGSIRPARENIRRPGSVRAALANLEASQRQFAPRSYSVPGASGDKQRYHVRGEDAAVAALFRASQVTTPELTRGRASPDSAATEECISKDSNRRAQDQTSPSDSYTTAHEGLSTTSRWLEDSESRPGNPEDGIVVTRSTSITHHTQAQPSCLRGGGNSSTPAEQKQFVPAIFTRLRTLSQSERPHSTLWWLAGGKVGNRRCVPTVQELRERRLVEERNRDIVGFWETVPGVRAVRHSPREVVEDEGDGEEGGEEKGEKMPKDEGSANGEEKEEVLKAEEEIGEIGKDEGSVNEDEKKDIGDG